MCVCVCACVRDFRRPLGCCKCRNGKRRLHASKITAPLGNRLELDETTADMLAESMDNMSQHADVKLLNFAFLKIDTNKVLGAGGTARVFHGSYRSRDVAVKLSYPPELTPADIKGFAEEVRTAASCFYSTSESCSRGACLLLGLASARLRGCTRTRRTTRRRP